MLLSGPPMTPAEQGDEVVTLGMRARNVDEASIAEALTLNRQLTQVYRTDSGWDSATAALRVASTRPWFSASVIAVIPRTDPHWQWFRRILDYDPLPALRDLTIPILGVYGERDILVPGPRAKAIIDSVARTAKGPRESAVIPGATHELRPWGNSKWSPDYWALLEAWMRRHRLLL